MHRTTERNVANNWRTISHAAAFCLRHQTSEGLRIKVHLTPSRSSSSRRGRGGGRVGVVPEPCERSPPRGLFVIHGGHDNGRATMTLGYCTSTSSILRARCETRRRRGRKRPVRNCRILRPGENHFGTSTRPVRIDSRR